MEFLFKIDITFIFYHNFNIILIVRLIGLRYFNGSALIYDFDYFRFDYELIKTKKGEGKRYRINIFKYSHYIALNKITNYQNIHLI